MTDTTQHELPEQIWAKPPICWCGDRAKMSGGAEYILKSRSDDLVRAAVAANLREAINRVNGCDRISEVQPAILALIREGGE